MFVVNWFLAPFQYDFMQHAFLAGTLAAMLTSLVGFFVVIRQLGFAAHALGHIGFAGACGAFLLGWPPLVGQLAISLAAGGVMSGIGKRLHERDTIIGVTLAFALGLGVLFLHFYHAHGSQMNSILFGDLLGVATSALYWMGALTVLGILSLACIARPLWFASLAPALAEAKSVSLSGLSILFFILMATAITLASQVVGILLVFTLVVGPPAIALRWTRTFWAGIFTSLLLSLGIVWCAIYLAYYLDWPISFWISALVFGLYFV
ncbi:MAG: metal ABC transporter permease [Gammaproteobacteria bacterium]